MPPRGTPDFMQGAKLTEREKATILALFAEGKTPKEVKVLIRGRTSLRNLQRMKLKKVGIDREKKEIAKKDEVVVWEDIETMLELGIPREHIRRLGEVAALMAMFFTQADKELFTQPRITYRSLKWQSFVLTYTAPNELKSIEIWAIAEQYAYRELYADYSGKKIDVDDITDWIRYAPWRNPQALETYKRAIEAGGCKPRRIVLKKETDTPKYAVSLGLCFLLELMGTPDMSYMLPCQQISRAYKTGKDLHITVQGDGGSTVRLGFKPLPPEATASQAPVSMRSEKEELATQ